LSFLTLSAILKIRTAILVDMSQNQTKNKNGSAAVKVLISSRKKILNDLKKVITVGNFNYRTFGTAIEEYLTNIIVDIFKKANFIKNEKDYVVAPHKNYFPDFELKTIPSIAIEFKSGNRSQNRQGKWVVVKNSENDMGTLNEWPNRIKKFGGRNIYYIFVIYNFNEKTKEVQNIEVAPFYSFLGLNKAKLLKYREKDGNLRPKDFDVSPPIKKLEQFEQLFRKTVIYRSKRIIKKHRKIIKEAQDAKTEKG